jgi:hypothetical protein
MNKLTSIVAAALLPVAVGLTGCTKKVYEGEVDGRHVTYFESELTGNECYVSNGDKITLTVESNGPELSIFSADPKNVSIQRVNILNPITGETERYYPSWSNGKGVNGAVASNIFSNAESFYRDVRVAAYESNVKLRNEFVEKSLPSKQ